ncbi:patatin-like phospholipase domain-containing protein 4 [Mya arenaria]|uniref:patatin-like phospholipase domain-containing protein 4 n=1 Tax=Mya arenaria TaxID=6604 RepID=UPI0022DF6070|nr:patatin-like phospholipase domain-containing protein 4 [Mya arenaria]XP_052782857.1 patatin-like phospholipase domain-containing protein 4 [Mya arenaria]
MNISFCGAGFLGIYHMGVLKALRSSAPKFLSRIERVGGASAGSLAGVVLVCEPEKVEECTQFNLALSDEVRRKPLGSFTPNYNLLDSVRAFIDSTLSHDAHHRANGILYISLTSFDGRSLPKNTVVSKYTSRDELIQCLISSCYIPGYIGLAPPKIDGKFQTDGGLTNNLITFPDGRTVTVSPFSGHQDICPKDDIGRNMHVHMKNQTFRVNQKNGARAVHAMFPPSRDVLVRYFEQGYSDAMVFVMTEKLS